MLGLIWTEMGHIKKKKKRSCHTPFILNALLKLKMPYRLNGIHVLLNTSKTLLCII